LFFGTAYLANTLLSITAPNDRARLLSEEASTEKVERIPILAKQIELILYQRAPTFDAYIDMSTLRSRLKELENSIPSSDATSKKHDTQS
jgi:hypothetical protein